MPVAEKTLLVAAHGSSQLQARGALEAFTGRVAAAHPGARIQLAYTASPRSGNHSPKPNHTCLESILADLTRQGRCCDVRVLSLHVIAGNEFERTLTLLEAFAARAGMAQDERNGACARTHCPPLRISGPLLSRPEDAPAVAAALAESLGAPDPHEAVVLMGHGTVNQAQGLYRALAAELRERVPQACLGVLECADPDDPLSIQAIARAIRQRHLRRARLVPFLTISGRHARRDLAGDQPGSWKSLLEAHGVACAADLAGLVEREPFAACWLARAHALLGA